MRAENVKLDRKEGGDSVVCEWLKLRMSATLPETREACSLVQFGYAPVYRCIRSGSVVYTILQFRCVWVEPNTTV